MNYLWAVSPLILFWVIVAAARTPWRGYLDKLTKGRYNPDKTILDLTLVSLLQESGEWIVNKKNKHPSFSFLLHTSEVWSN